MNLDLATHCPSKPVIDLATGKVAGYFYEMHIRPEGDTRTECQTCGMQFGNTPLTSTLRPGDKP